MRTSFTFITPGLLLAMVCDQAQTQTAGQEYQNWCIHHADSERLTEPQRQHYIKECMESLAAADNIPGNIPGNIQDTSSDTNKDEE